MDQAAQHFAGEGQKSSLAFRTISEVSVEIDVPQHVLRFWESRFSQVKPMKRGGGRRYYRPEDVELLRQIKTYLYKHGYTIKGVQRLLKEHRMSELPSLAAYRMQAGQEMPDENFPSNFEETLAEVTTPEAKAKPVSDDPLAQGLAAMTLIHDELEIPVEPMRVQSADDLVRAALARPDEENPQPAKNMSEVAVKETGYAMGASQAPVAAQPLKGKAKAELGEILAELHALRDLLRSVSA